jgi:carbon monoxide dehydrogenase subunit G
MANYRLRLGISIEAPAETVFAFLENPVNAWAGYPKAEITDVTVTPEGIGTTNRFRVAYLGIREKGTHEYTEFIPNRRIGVQSSLGPFFGWTVEPEAAGTRLTLDVEEDGKLAYVINSLLEKRMRRGFETMLATIKASVEDAEEAPPPKPRSFGP